jgi:hypothetical protein
VRPYAPSAESMSRCSHVTKASNLNVSSHAGICSRYSGTRPTAYSTGAGELYAGRGDLGRPAWPTKPGQGISPTEVERTRDLVELTGMRGHRNSATSPALSSESGENLSRIRLLGGFPTRKLTMAEWRAGSAAPAKISEAPMKSRQRRTRPKATL